MEKLSTIQLVSVWILPILFAVTLHEAAHGLVAYKLGDNTAYLQGRITLNPLKHIDPIGTIVVPTLLLLSTNFLFGWAKPVPVNYAHLKNPRRDMAWVALAGPLSNFMMAVIWAVLLKLGIVLTKGQLAGGQYVLLVSQAGVMINVILMVLNILPIPPLDGSRLVSAILPPRIAKVYESTALAGMLLLILLAATGILGQFLLGPINAVQHFLIKWIV